MSSYVEGGGGGGGGGSGGGGGGGRAGAGAGGRLGALLGAFVLCQLWTLYLEALCGALGPHSDAHAAAVSVLLDFWCKLVPTVLHLTTHSKLVSTSTAFVLCHLYLLHQAATYLPTPYFYKKVNLQSSY